MPDTKIDSAVSTDLEGAQTTYTPSSATTAQTFQVDHATLDSPGDQKESYYTNSDWSKQLGFYKQSPELASAVHAKATWTIGGGYTADELTTLQLMRIRGIGSDTFNTILENMLIIMELGGDSYAEKIYDTDGELINLKPLNPGTIRVVANRKGIILRYEQLGKGNKVKHVFQPEEIFHLSRNRIGDEFHGQSMIPQIEDTLLMVLESMADGKTLQHRFVVPRFFFHVDTDDATEIAAFKTKLDEMWDKSENIIIPKDAVEPELISVPPNSTLDPKTWVALLWQRIYNATGIGDIIVGASTSLTEAASKVKYLVFERTIKQCQLYVKEQVLFQLGMEIELDPPASLQNDMITDQRKDGNTAFQPNDTTMEGIE
jgi:hypothetical protein